MAAGNELLTSLTTIRRILNHAATVWFGFTAENKTKFLHRALFWTRVSSMLDTENTNYTTVRIRGAPNLWGLSMGLRLG